MKIPKLPSVMKDPNQSERTVLYLKPDMKKLLTQRAKSVGLSTTKYIEKILKQALGI